VLSGAQENMSSIEHTMAARVSEFVAAMSDLTSKSGETTSKVEQHLGTFNNVTAKVLHDLGDLADQFSSHGRTLADAVELLDTSNRRTDDSIASRHAHGAAYATYVGSWRRRFRITAGLSDITRYEDGESGTVRSFCARCGTPVCYERSHSPHMVNVPRALFKTRTGRQPRRDDGPARARLVRRVRRRSRGMTRYRVLTILSIYDNI